MSTVGILVRPDLGAAGPAVRQLVDWLRARKVRAALEDRTAAMIPDLVLDGVSVAPRELVAAAADVVVVLGGDGTLLAASHVIGRPVPVLGVNFGSLGFLTEITLPELFPTLEGVLAGTYRWDERRLLQTAVRRHGHPDSVGEVLNDVVITRTALSRIVELDVWIDGTFVSAFRADGIIVSSPTGSTAYNLAAGGPILHPSLPAIVLTPICPHMLSNRPLVVGDASLIEIRLGGSRDNDVHLTLDGQRGMALEPEDVVTVTRSDRTVRLVRAPDRDYYEVLRTKLKWGDSSRRS
jgi:NAD+ kinase